MAEEKRDKIASGKEAAEPKGTEERIVSVVSIGASAGGFEAFSEILRHLPTQTGLAFVFVQHLDPHHSSQLVPILTRETALPIKEAIDGELLQPRAPFIAGRCTAQKFARQRFRGLAGYA